MTRRNSGRALIVDRIPAEWLRAIAEPSSPEHEAPAGQPSQATRYRVPLDGDSPVAIELERVAKVTASGPPVQAGYQCTIRDTTSTLLYQKTLYANQGAVEYVTAPTDDACGVIRRFSMEVVDRRVRLQVSVGSPSFSRDVFVDEDLAGNPPFLRSYVELPNEGSVFTRQTLQALVGRFCAADQIHVPRDITVKLAPTVYADALRFLRQALTTETNLQHFFETNGIRVVCERGQRIENVGLRGAVGPYGATRVQVFQRVPRVQLGYAAGANFYAAPPVELSPPSPPPQLFGSREAAAEAANALNAFTQARLGEAHSFSGAPETNDETASPQSTSGGSADLHGRDGCERGVADRESHARRLRGLIL